jgi:lipid-A-disaccharide synthase
MSAGESSGDAHGAEVVHYLHKIAPPDLRLTVWGMGGPRLREAAVDLIQDSSDLGVIGVADVLKKLPFFLNLEKRLLEEIKKRRPDVALLIDYPGLNLRLAAAIKKELPFCKVVFYVAPQVWAWNPGRLKKLPSLVDRLLVILPFEENLHKNAGTSCRFVGNPSAWSLANTPDFDRMSFLNELGLEADKPLVGIFPGSRNREIDFMLPVFLQAAKELKALWPDVQFVLVRANTISQEKLAQHFQKAEVNPNLIRVETSEKNYHLLKSIDVAWLTSGTVTLEAACAATPLILGYKENPFFFKGYLLLRQIDKIGLPNIISGEDLCPELLQEDCTPEKWVELTKTWLTSPETLRGISETLHKKITVPLQPGADPAITVAHEILMINQLNHLKLENEIHKKEQAHQNSQKTSREMAEKGTPREQAFKNPIP